MHMHRLNTPSANQVSKSAEQVADAVSETERLHARIKELKADLRAFDAVIDEEGIARSCINPVEDLRIAIRALKAASQTASAASPVAGVSADVSRIARQVVKRVVENAICSQWTRTLSALEADMDAEWPSEDDLVQDALALALGDDTGCLSEEDEDFREHIDVLWLEDILAAHFVLAQPSAEGDGEQ